MAKIATQLTDTKIKKATEGNYFDGQGLYIQVTTKGKKLWRIKYKYKGKDKRKSLGEYPIVTLKAARKKRENILTALEDGLDPFAPEAETAKSFKHYATEYLTRKENEGKLSEGHLKRIRQGFEHDVYSFIGKKAMDEITPGDIVKLLHVMRDRGVIDSAKKVFSSIKKLYSYTISNNPDIIQTNPCGGLSISDIVESYKQKSYAGYTNDADLKVILNKIDNTEQYEVAKRGLQLLQYTAVRPNALRLAVWDEFDFEENLWTIPAEKMKDRNELLTPLATQVVLMLKEWKQTSTGDRLFPARNSTTSAMHNDMMARVLRAEEVNIVPHSWRTMFSTIAHGNLKDKGFTHEAIELQLSHSLGTVVSKKYNRADLLPERRELMQWYADYLDGVRNG